MRLEGSPAGRTLCGMKDPSSGNYVPRRRDGAGESADARTVGCADWEGSSALAVATSGDELDEEVCEALYEEWLECELAAAQVEMGDVRLDPERFKREFGRRNWEASNAWLRAVKLESEADLYAEYAAFDVGAESYELHAEALRSEARELRRSIPADVRRVAAWRSTLLRPEVVAALLRRPWRAHRVRRGRQPRIAHVRRCRGARGDPSDANGEPSNPRRVASGLGGAS